MHFHEIRPNEVRKGDIVLFKDDDDHDMQLTAESDAQRETFAGETVWTFKGASESWSFTENETLHLLT